MELERRRVGVLEDGVGDEAGLRERHFHVDGADGVRARVAREAGGEGRDGEGQARDCVGEERAEQAGCPGESPREGREASGAQEDGSGRSARAVEEVLESGSRWERPARRGRRRRGREQWRVGRDGGRG